MKNLLAVLTSLLLALLLATSGHGAVRFGVTEDAGKYADDGGVSFFATLNDLGMTENRITVFWDAAHPTEIQEQAFLDRSLPVRPARVVAVAVNTRFLDDEEAARDAVAGAEAETGLPADDPVRFGPSRLLDAVLEGLKTWPAAAEDSEIGRAF